MGTTRTLLTAQEYDSDNHGHVLGLLVRLVGTRIVWEITHACRTCEGAGSVYRDVGEGRCPDCGGTAEEESSYHYPRTGEELWLVVDEAFQAGAVSALSLTPGELLAVMAFEDRMAREEGRPSRSAQMVPARRAA